MTSSNRNFFRVTGHLCGEFTGFRWIPPTKASDVFIDLCPNNRLSKQSWDWWFETPLGSLWRHSNVMNGGTEMALDVFRPDQAKNNKSNLLWIGLYMQIHTRWSPYRFNIIYNTPREIWMRLYCFISVISAVLCVFIWYSYPYHLMTLFYWHLHWRLASRCDPTLKMWINITMTSQWAWWRLRSPASRLFTQPFIRTQIKENIKAPRHWPLCGEFTGDRWIPRTNGQ